MRVHSRDTLQNSPIVRTPGTPVQQKCVTLHACTLSGGVRPARSAQESPSKPVSSGQSNGQPVGCYRAEQRPVHIVKVMGLWS
mmetsp:Transcript_4565/g.10712  ORF Transcript_4565/g.10712 Transcript_4565/m.10712 type:complete len:83 (-) Transcript_4565:1466-1714(-)